MGVSSFYPPLHVQRRRKLFKILQGGFPVRSLLDIGCGDARFLSYLVPCNDQVPIEFLAGIDINEQSIERATEALQVRTEDFLQLRWRPLHIELLLGNIKDFTHYKHVDAVVASEFIEHCQVAEILAFEKLVFGNLKPNVCVVSTPNFEFNTIFEKLSTLTSSISSRTSTNFRHPEHVFEWDRKEFAKWAYKICKRYPEYTVEFTGCGLLNDLIDGDDLLHFRPSSTYGFCTQIAVFHQSKNNAASHCFLKDQNSSILLYKKITYPFMEQLFPPTVQQFMNLLKKAFFDHLFGRHCLLLFQVIAGKCALSVKLPFLFIWESSPLIRHAFHYDDSIYLSYCPELKKSKHKGIALANSFSFRIAKVLKKSRIFIITFHHYV
ncbi:small RNA 2'-O-methyltransferase Hen1 [Schizosaccharomyces pombe]|uniref:Small RNA 2'-O-methyltransferase n=1 Tax=Schizosaccharomyces pombe (strain 972 / ATCC 24843) TaxID=284812 RepID=HENMT_SCHPO|nr:putative S-adenosylmethionine-dependent methyltransferase [Schizosaccharomyces pombe]Q9UST9.1 RecName: Full=Small RNA 2'-O-methyltransferase; AltName: Full=HEN1 methyltransferase homolog [Schizosaccharomyces pombe 972h-]CAB58157.1 S-adenosylmethionine-dependent methyltransferase (predicted) [Schizosaccharomyces pombe]|eukprot:NP_596125.1 putative S-adenosylmethionine-dependent methyltransferase [Schizosaccharomyces pombe]